MPLCGFPEASPDAGSKSGASKLTTVIVMVLI
jgi:hypothetical protein